VVELTPRQLCHSSSLNYVLVFVIYSFEYTSINLFLYVRHLRQESGRRNLLQTEKKHDMSVAASLVFFGLETDVK
jgi:hypothetical protein